MSESSEDAISTSDDEGEGQQTRTDLWVFSESEPESFSDAEGADENGKWEVEIIGEEVDGRGDIRYEASWKGWSRADGTNTTWDNSLLHPADISSWKQKQTRRRNQLARESLDIDIWTTMDIHNTATYLRTQAFAEKLEKRKKNPLRLRQQMEQLLAEKRGTAQAPPRASSSSGTGSGRSFTRESSASTSASQTGSFRGRTRSSSRRMMMDPLTEPLFSTPEPHTPASSSSKQNSISASASASASGSRNLKRPARWSSSDSYQPSAASYMSVSSTTTMSVSSITTTSTNSNGKGRAAESPYDQPTLRSHSELEAHAIRPLPRRAHSSSLPSKQSSSSGLRPLAIVPTSSRRKLEQDWTGRARASGAAAITISNDVDDEEIPLVSSGFRYLESEYLYSNKVPRMEDEDVFVRCECQGDCDGRVCNCQEPSELVDEDGNKIFAYTPDGLFAFNVPRGVEVIECNDHCQCDRSICANRVAQRPRDFPVEIFKTQNRGWGVRSPVDIAHGKVLGIYTGLLIRRDVAVADTRSHHFYFDLDGRETPSADIPEDAYSVDARRCGNWSRFINHSCDPNLLVYLVVYDTIPEMNMPYVAFAATKDIPAGTEFTFDYNPAATTAVLDAKRKKRRTFAIPDGAELCRCGAKVCRGWVRV